MQRVPKMANLSNRLQDYNLSHSDLYWEVNFHFLPGTANCVRQHWWNLMLVLLYSLLNRGGYLGWAQECQLSAALSPGCPPSPPPPDSLTVCAMMSCCSGGVFGGVLGVEGTVAGQQWWLNPWPSGRDLLARRHQLSEASLQQRGQNPHVATSPLLALAGANDLRSWPRGQKVGRRPWSNTSFSECSNICIQHPLL